MTDEPKPFTKDDPQTWPQTTQVFNPPRFNFGDHKWVQRGYFLHDECEGCVRQAIQIPSGKMLVKEKGEYQLVDEKR